MAQKAKKTIRGGARKGSGRKPVEDPKLMIPLYVKTSVVNSLGGLEEVRSACYAFLRSKIGEETEL